MDSYRNYLENLIVHDIQGLVINGTTGESPAVSWEEVVELVQSTKVSLIGKKNHLPLIIGTGTNHTLSTSKTDRNGGKNRC